MKTKENLIYDLIFSENSEYVINVTDYIEDIYKYDRFIFDVKEDDQKYKVTIVKDKVDLETKRVIWNLKVKR